MKVEVPTSGLTAQEAEYINQKSFTAQRIVADIFRCPLHMFGLTGAPTFASVEQSSIEFVQYTLTPIISNIEQQIQKQLLDDDEDVYINFNVSGLLRGDIAARIAWYKFALEHGVMTANQVSDAEDLGASIPTDAGGDTYLVPANMMKAGTRPVAPVE
jgi:HK97 family phage portal protein